MSQLKRSKLALRGLLIGIVLGDGTLSKANSKQNSHLLIGHSIKQKDYCNSKLNLVSSLLNTSYHIKEYRVFNKKTNKHYPIIQGATKVHRYLTKLRKVLYDNGTKKITEKILNYLTPEGLAYWYMDDGGVISYHKKKKIDGVFFSTQNFSYEEHLLIQKYFKDKWDINCRIGKHGKGKYRISINKTNSYKLIGLISPYIYEDLRYKTILNYSGYLIEFNKINSSVEL